MCQEWSIRKVTYPSLYTTCVQYLTHLSMTVSLGPIGTVLKDIPKNPRNDGFASNPRCLRRDVNRYASSMLYANYTYNLITKADTVDLFQSNMLGMPHENDWGVHMSGHYVIGGDPGGVSPTHILDIFRVFSMLIFNTGLLLVPRRSALLVSSWYG
jgi:hypothetical protein